MRGLQKTWLGWVLAGCAVLGSAGPVAADGRAFTDSRDRFKLQLPSGWSLAPQPGDTEGMVFRRKAGDVPGIVAVKVSRAAASDSHVSVMDKRCRAFQREIGFERLTEGEAMMGDLRALRRVHTVFLNGDDRLKRYSVDHVLMAYGYAHYIHFETANGSYKTFQRDLEQILQSYRPMAGKRLYARLIGGWRAVGGADASVLELRADQFFSQGSRTGTWRADGKRVTFTEALNSEQFRYLVDDDLLTLHSERMPEPVSYQRVTGSQTVSMLSDEERAAQERREMKITRKLVVGTWVVVEGGDAHELMLSEGGAMRFGPMSGRYTLRDNLVTIESVTGVRITYTLQFDGKRLKMTGGDLDRPLLLERRQ